MSEKRIRMTLKSDTMPDEVYKILNEKALKRNLTPFIIELVLESIKSKSLFDKLDIIETKIDGIASKNFIIINDFMEEEEILKEGLIVRAEDVIGGIDEDDKKECDF